MHKLRLLALSTLVFATAALSAVPLAQAQRTAGNAGFLRVMHALPDAPAVDVWLDNQAWARNLGYTGFTGHMVVPAGSHRIAIVPTGQSIEQALVNSTMDVADDQAYTIFAIGRQADMRAIVLTDAATAPSPLQTDAGMRVVHTVPGAPAIDVLRANEQGVFDVPALVANVEFGTGSGYQNVEAGAATLRIEAAGTDNVLATLPNANFAQDGVYTLVVAAGQGGQGFQAVWLWDKIGSAIGAR